MDLPVALGLFLASAVVVVAGGIALAMSGDVIAIRTGWGRLWVGSLLAPAPENHADEATAIIFIADTEARETSATEVLQDLYQLTRAEADLVRLLSAGHSLEEVAETRSVTMNTVRSQLKQVFCKTDTSRQGELVHLVLTGIAAIRTDDDPGVGV